MRLVRPLVLAVSVVLSAGAAAHAAAPQPNTPEYAARDAANIADAYGRITAPDGQLQNPAYLPALVEQGLVIGLDQLREQAATPDRPALTLAQLVPGANVGNPLRAGWNGSRGVATPVAFTNRYGALLRGTVYTPKPGAKDPYTGARLKGPFPGVVVTPGSVQGSSEMYAWLGQDLAERGYVVLVYDTQGQGNSETLPHQGGVFPYCNPLEVPEPTEQSGCPGVTSQQPANFVKGTEDAIDFFFSTPTRRYPNTGAGSTSVDRFNPQWRQFDRSKDSRTATPGRTSRFAIVGHSLGAAAVSKVQGTDKRVAAVVALDKLQGGGFTLGPLDVGTVTPKVPALAVQSEYGFTVTPFTLSGGSSITPGPGNPDPMRERKTGFDAWRAKKIDSMLVVPRASTHLEYTDIPLVLPASRYGQALTSVYTQAWLDRYLKHRGVTRKPTGTDPLLATSLRYLEPKGSGTWAPITLKRSERLSFYYCSAYAFTDRNGTTRRSDGDIADLGGCAK